MNDRLWALISWGLLGIGALLGLIFKGDSYYVRRWAYLSIAFTILVIVFGILILIMSLIFSLIPFIGFILSSILKSLYGIGVLSIYIIGLVKIAEGTIWNPPVIYEISEFIMRI